MQGRLGWGGRSERLRGALLRAALVTALCAWSGCRIQRGGGVPEEPAVAPARTGGAGAQAESQADEVAPEPARVATSSTSAASSGSSAAQGGAASPGPMDAGVAASAPKASAGSSAGRAGASAPQASAADGCGRTVSKDGCNPITNEGCAMELGMQCDVDVTTSELRGVCVFSAPAPDGSTCLNLPPTESCPPGQTCVDFSECRKVCLCDDDCDAGNCCDGALGSSGFKTCKTC